MGQATLEWKDPLRRMTPNHPAGLVELDDSEIASIDGGTTWACAAVTATVGVSIAFCSPNGTLCGSCNFGTQGCC